MQTEFYMPSISVKRISDESFLDKARRVHIESLDILTKIIGRGFNLKPAEVKEVSDKTYGGLFGINKYWIGLNTKRIKKDRLLADITTAHETAHYIHASEFPSDFHGRKWGGKELFAVAGSYEYFNKLGKKQIFMDEIKERGVLAEKIFERMLEEEGDELTRVILQFHQTKNIWKSIQYCSQFEDYARQEEELTR